MRSLFVGGDQQMRPDGEEGTDSSMGAQPVRQIYEFSLFVGVTCLCALISFLFLTCTGLLVCISFLFRVVCIT